MSEKTQTTGLTLKDWIKFPFILMFVIGGVLLSLPVIFFRSWAALSDKFFREMNRG